MKISVIIPIFNKESSINKCLKSICEQNYNELELVLIDDGSSDNSIDVALEYLEGSNIEYKVIQQKNAGPSAARNRGIEIASGDYIMFVDADDYILSGMLERLVYLSEKYNADLVECGYNANTQLPINENNEIHILKREESIRSLLTNSTVKPVVWASLYKKCIINDVRFNERLHLGEDTCFKISILKNIDIVVWTNEVFYVNVTKDNDSLSRKQLSQRDIYSVIEYLKIAEQELSCFTALQKTMYKYLYRVSVSYYARMIRENVIFEKDIYMKLNTMIAGFEKKIGISCFEYYIEIRLLRHNIGVYNLLYKMIRG